MRLSEFIMQEMETILQEWDAFAARHIPATANMSPTAVRDHAKQILVEVAKDLLNFQTKQAQEEKSKGQAPEIEGNPETAAETHAVLRAKSGFDINELVAEYRALRASILRLWIEAYGADSLNLEDLVRFNEAIDQAIAESIKYFSAQVERSRNLMLAMLSHDMRTPLSTIQMTASFLESGEDVSTAVSLLTCASLEMKCLLDDMVDLKKSMLGLGINITLSHIEMAEAFASELELLRAAYPDRKLELEVLGDTWGHWDGPRLRRLLRNLVSNAIKYGTTNIPVRTIISGDATSVRIEVINSGPTIEPSELDRIFNPFQRFAADDVEGTNFGLGLFFVREVAQAHKGSVSVHSAEGLTTFDVVLPRRNDSPQHSVAP